MTGVARDLRSRRFQKTLIAQFLAAIGFQATALQLYDVIEPDKLGKLDVPVGLPVLAIAFLFALGMSWPRPIQQQYSKPNTKIRLVEGDLFAQTESLVIGMSDTFDTAVPNIIAKGSVQGQFLNRVYASDIEALDKELQSALDQVAALETITKPGKTQRYPLGTVAVLEHTGRRRSYCLAYSKMNAQNEARGSVEGVWHSLDCLWRTVRTHSNGEPLAITVIGGGQSRLAQILPARDAIRLTALSFILACRFEKVCERLDIVIRPQDVRMLDMPELQAFLRSLE